MAGSVDKLLNAGPLIVLGGPATHDSGTTCSYRHQGLKVPQIAPWIGGLICTICTHCTDDSALQEKLVNGNFLSSTEYEAASHQASQIAIWGNLIGVLVLQRYPRCMGCIGGFLAFVASFIFMTLDTNSANQTLAMMAMGFMKLGGKFAFSASLSFTNLLPAKQGLLDGINGGMTDSSGLVFLPVINSSDVSLRAWFCFVAVLALLCSLSAILVFPDDAYDRGDQAHLSKPSLRARQRRPSQARGSLTDQLRAFLDVRLIGFVFSWAWCATALDWRKGSMKAALASNAPPQFFSWGVTISSNMAILSAPTVGFLIDLTVPRWGYCAVGFLMLSSTALLLAVLLAHSDVLLWISLVPDPLNVSLIWLTYYNYIQRCYPVEVMPCLLVVSTILQGLLGFLNAFAFPENPWGKDYRPLVLFFAVPLVPLIFWPVLEYLRADKQRVAGRRAELESQETSGDGTEQVA